MRSTTQCHPFPAVYALLARYSANTLYKHLKTAFFAKVKLEIGLSKVAKRPTRVTTLGSID